MAVIAKASRLRADRFTTAEHRRLVWVAEVEAGTTPADLEAPSYWAHVAHMLKPALGDKRLQINKIEAYAEAGSWYAEALVRRIGASEVFVTVLRVELLDATRDEALPADTHEGQW